MAIANSNNQVDQPNTIELSKYLEESLEIEALDVLNWWILDYGLFFILAKIA